MKEVNQISEKQKEVIKSRLYDLYNPTSIGQIERYPPYGEYFVTLYFEKHSFRFSNRYNYQIDDFAKGNLCDFEISNINKVGNEVNVTIKVTMQ